MKKCDNKKCKPALDNQSGRQKVVCDTCGLETMDYTSSDLALFDWNENKVFKPIKNQNDEDVNDNNTEAN